ncbi:MAG: hypothetical protein IT374_21425 [Polyangiaceae bacterium]|nr:hypothetical protein [Polyangiaceae bacterium]
MFEQGYLRLFRVGGVPVRAHWSVPLGLLLLSRLRFAPGVWLGFVIVILLHELGHALLVRRAGLPVLGVDLSGLGGLCRFAGPASPWQAGVIAWGGVLAQAPLAAGAFVAWRAGLVGPSSTFAADLLDTLIYVNLWIAGFNLLPVPGLDGATAWPLLGMWWRRRRAPRPSTRPTARAEGRAAERGVVVPLDPYRAKRRAERESDPPDLPDDVRREMERILKDAAADARRKKDN